MVSYWDNKLRREENITPASCHHHHLPRRFTPPRPPPIFTPDLLFLSVIHVCLSARLTIESFPSGFQYRVKAKGQCSSLGSGPLPLPNNNEGYKCSSLYVFNVEKATIYSSSAWDKKKGSTLTHTGVGLVIIRHGKSLSSQVNGNASIENKSHTRHTIRGWGASKWGYLFTSRLHFKLLWHVVLSLPRGMDTRFFQPGWGVFQWRGLLFHGDGSEATHWVGHWAHVWAYIYDTQ